jgi:zinc protease
MKTKKLWMAALGVTAALLPSPLAAQEGRAARVIESAQRWVHPSGAVVFLVERHDLPYVSFEVAARTGSLWDPAGKEGLASLTSQWMLRGAGARSRAQLQDTLDALGADLEADNDRSSISWSGDTLSRNLEQVMGLLGDVLWRPKLEKGELQKLKRELESDLLQTQDYDQSLNRRFFDRYLFGTHPYGRPSDGTPKGLKAIQADDARRFYQDHVVSENLVFGFAGDVTRAQVEALLDGPLGGHRPGKPPALSVPALPTDGSGRQVLLVDKPDRTQSQLLVGHLGPLAGDPDLPALEVVNTVFGGTFTARLNHEIRDQRGLSYGAYSNVEEDRFAGIFSIWTFPSTQDTMKTLGLILDLFEKLRAEPLTAQEVEFARQYLVHSFAFRFDTPDKLLGEVMQAELDGLPADWLLTWEARLRAVTVEQANAAVQRWLHPEHLLISMLCSAAGFEEPMRALPGVSTVKVVRHNAPF